MTLTVLIGMSLASAVFGHARLKSDGSLKPRNSDAGLKTGPCGGVARTASPNTYKAGQTIQVQWEETVNHPGRFEFYFSPAGDTGFRLLKTVADDQGENALPHQFETTLTLPAEECEACTIQMIQVMTENPDNPRNYYSCADLKLLAADPAEVPADDGDSAGGGTAGGSAGSTDSNSEKTGDSANSGDDDATAGAADNDGKGRAGKGQDCP